MTALGDELRRLREERAMSQARLACVLDLNAAAVSRWESGGRVPGVRRMALIASALGLDDAELVRLVRLAAWGNG